MSDIEVVERVYAAFVANDLEGLLDLADEECVILQDPALPWGGRHVGRDGITGFALALVGTIESTLSTDALFESDGHVVQSGRSRGVVRATGMAFDLAEVHVWTVKDGRIVSGQFLSDTAGMLQALGA